MWFTETPGDAIGRITPTGHVTEFRLPSGSSPSGITTGPDGALWFTEPGNNGARDVSQVVLARQPFTAR